MIKFINSTAIILSLCIAFAACNDENESNPIVPEVLIDAEPFETKTAAEIKSFVDSKNLPVNDALLKYDVDIYKVTYKTTYKGNSITASGLVALPKTNDAVGMLSFQHGTISAHQDAPTSLSNDDEELYLYATVASVGFVGVVPDYIGFGESKNILHPYYVEKPTADAVLDNVRAARELALVNNITLNKRLFLAGYSQGGYATMAAHKAIEEQNGVEDLDLVASFPAAGGYDVKGVQEYFFSQDTYHEPFYVAYVAAAYKNYYDWEQPLSVMFNEPYASKIPVLFDGTKSGSQINAELTEQMNDLIGEDILENIDSKTEYEFIRDAFIENSLTDWTPKTLMYMYHGTADITVPYQNSVDTYNTFIQNGASSTIVTFTPLHFATHGTGITPYILELTNKLIALK